jgi:phosphoglucosamine mutase
VLTGLIVCDLVSRRGALLSTLAAAMTRLPQVLVNVRLERKVNLAAELGVLDAVRTVEAELGDRGRVLVRSSGTEPLLRVMVEAPTSAEAEASAARIVTAVRRIETQP